MNDLMTKKFILNPDYDLINDKKRILFIYIGNELNKSFFQFIHPIHAQLLSFFDGKLCLEDTLKQVQSYFNISQAAVWRLVSPLIENTENRLISYDNHKFLFPTRTLIQSDNNLRNDLPIDNFMIDRELDFSTLRLSKPVNMLFVINTHCFTNCSYCYADRTTRYNALTTQRTVELIREMKNIGVKQLDFSGGEFFLHKDWDVIAKTAIDCGFHPEISTKYPLSSLDIDKLIKVGLSCVQFSLDSMNNELLKNSIGIADGYIDKMVHSIRELDLKGIELIIKPTLSKTTCTVENVKKVLEFVESLKNVKRCIISIIGYSQYKALSAFYDLRPSLEQIQAVQQYVLDRARNVSYNLLFDTLPFEKVELCNPIRFKNRSVCSANVHGFVILPDGKVTLCEELYWNPDFIIGDLTKESILDVWESDRALLLSNLNQSNFPKDSACATCEEFKDCRLKQGVCWKYVIAAYGRTNRYYPDPSCPKAPKPFSEFYY